MHSYIPDQTRPDQTRPDQIRPDQTRRDETRPDQTRPDETRRDETRPDQTRQDKTRQDKTRPYSTYIVRQGMDSPFECSLRILSYHIVLAVLKALPNIEFNICRGFPTRRHQRIGLAQMHCPRKQCQERLPESFIQTVQQPRGQRLCTCAFNKSFTNRVQ